jgi:acetyl esterase/lipase
VSAPLVLLLWGLICAAGVAVSIWPPYRPGTVAVLVWPVGWLISELPLHQLAVQLGVGAALIAAGGLDGIEGWIGVAGLVFAAAGLRQHLVWAGRAPAAITRALDETFGREADAPPPAPTPWLTLATILPFRPRQVRRVRNVSYADGLALDVFTCDATCGTEPRPVFVYVHGGGWVIGNKGQQGRLTVHSLAAAGWVCVSVNYRLSPRATFPDHLIDVKRALAWVKANIAQHGGDPSFVVIGGGSAGAHLASLAALTAGRAAYQPGFEDADLSVQGCVAYYGVFDFVDEARHFRHRAFQELLLARIVMKAKLAAAAEAYAAASPTLQVCAAAPPFLVFHGDRDSLAPVSAARAFVAALRGACGSPVVYVELPGAQHAFELFPSLRSLAAVDGTRRFCQAIWRARRAHAHTPADVR